MLLWQSFIMIGTQILMIYIWLAYLPPVIGLGQKPIREDYFSYFWKWRDFATYGKLTSYSITVMTSQLIPFSLDNRGVCCDNGFVNMAF
jgi:hypothetical protein